MDRLTGHVIRHWGGKVGNEVGYVRRGFHPAQRDAVDGRGQILAPLAALYGHHPFIDVVPHVRADDTGTVGVDGNAKLGQFLGGHLGEATDGKLSRGISAQLLVANMAGNAGSVNNLTNFFAVRLPLELGRGRLDAKEDAINVGGVEVVEVFDRLVNQAAYLGDAGVVDVGV